MRVCIFEDGLVADLEPLTLTRPAFDLFCGQTSLAAKHRRYFAPSEVGFLVRPHLAPLSLMQRPTCAVNHTGWLQGETTVMVNARWLPPPGQAPELDSPCVATLGEEVAYAVVPMENLKRCTPESLEECLEAWKRELPRREAGGKLFRYLWEIVDHNGEQIMADSEGDIRHGDSYPIPLPAVVGPRDLMQVHNTARLDPMVVVDTTNGPVIVDEDAVITAFTRLEGPCYIGPNTQVHGAKIRAGTTLGPGCRIGGEVEASIVQGFTNKYHDGFLGHAYVGEWVNLGAGTQNSDLRNDYGSVKMTVNGRVVETGRAKIGCYLGDHTKTALGTLLNTGTNVGAFCNLLPGGLLPKYVPSFASWWNGAIADRADVWGLLQTAEKVMERRGCAFSDVHADLYRAVHEQTAGERVRAVRAAEMRRLRRIA